MDENLEQSIQIQQKFDFYFLSLVFTVLGLSIQTAHFSSSIQATLEITAWVFLLASGLAGLSRIEWIPASYNWFYGVQRGKSHIKELDTGRDLMTREGRIMSPSEKEQYVHDMEKEIKDGESSLYQFKKKNNLKYALHKWLFVVGVLLLISSRAINLFCS